MYSGPLKLGIVDSYDLEKILKAVNDKKLKKKCFFDHENSYQIRELLKFEKDRKHYVVIETQGSTHSIAEYKPETCNFKWIKKTLVGLVAAASLFTCVDLFKPNLEHMISKGLKHTQNYEQIYKGERTDTTRYTFNYIPSKIEWTNLPTSLNEEVTLKVATLNVWDFYGFPKRKKRMLEIGKLIKYINPDIVGLQEAFVKGDRKLLFKQLKDSRLKYSKYYYSGLFGSGLMLISAFPIKETNFYQYTKNGEWHKLWQGDWWVGKGVATALIELPNNAGHIGFYNTHTISEYNENKKGFEVRYTENRIHQMHELSDIIMSYGNSIPAILVGDINCRQDSVEYGILIKEGNVTRLMNIYSNVDHIFGVKNPNYIFTVSDTKNFSYGISETGKDMKISDHALWISTIHITPAAHKISSARD